MFKRFNGSVQPFASQASLKNRTVFGNVKQSDDINDNLNVDWLKGWEIIGVNGTPTIQDFNAVSYTLGNLVSYLYQQGIAQWDSKQNYYKGSIVVDDDNNIYKSLVGTSTTPNLNNQPKNSSRSWEIFVTGEVVDLTSNQIIGGNKQFLNNIILENDFKMVHGNKTIFRIIFDSTSNTIFLRDSKIEFKDYIPTHNFIPTSGEDITNVNFVRNEIKKSFSGQYVDKTTVGEKIGVIKNFEKGLTTGSNVASLMGNLASYNGIGLNSNRNGIYSNNNSIFLQTGSGKEIRFDSNGVLYLPKLPRVAPATPSSSNELIPYSYFHRYLHINMVKRNFGLGNNIFGKITTGNAGYDNVVIGNETLHDNTIGSGNVAIGNRAIQKNSDGDRNVIIGTRASGYTTLISDSVIVGYKAGPPQSSVENCICIGYEAGITAGVGTVPKISNGIWIGNSRHTRAYVTASWQMISDKRDKTNIKKLNLSLDFIKKLNTVSFEHKIDRETEKGNGVKRYGFLAQEVLKIEGDDNVIVDNDFEEHLSICMDYFIPILVNGIQDQQKMIEKQASQIEKQSSQFEDLKKQFEKQASQIEDLIKRIEKK